MNEKGTLKKEQNTLQNEQDTLQNKIFDGEQARVLNSEQAHLTMTHGKLCAMEAALEEKIEAINEKAAKEKQDIRSNLSLNFDSDTDSMETYIEFEAMSHSIDQYNIEQDAAQEKLGRVKRLRKAPYFARVKLQFDPEEAPEDYYIGSAGIAENAYEHLVIDWRSPIAETYYNQQNGKTFYMVNGNRVDVDLQLRRQYNLEEDRLFSFFDTQVAIEDPMLLQSLASRRTDKMKAITATIQKEQNAVIRSEDVPVLLVNGIAGSGKTSVLLQRIAYLFYRQRENLRPEQVYLLTINPVFRQYIDQVLPDLGEENPRTITWRDFLHIANAPDKGPGESAKEADLRKMERALKTLRLQEDEICPVMQKGRCVLSRREILNAAAELSGIEARASSISSPTSSLKLPKSRSAAWSATTATAQMAMMHGAEVKTAQAAIKAPPPSTAWTPTEIRGRTKAEAGERARERRTGKSRTGSRISTAARSAQSIASALLTLRRSDAGFCTRRD